MPGTDRVHVLIVANRTAATPKLLDQVRDRAAQGQCVFTLIVPQLPSAGEEEARETLALALPLLEDAAGGPVEGLTGPSDAFLAVQQVTVKRRVDEVIVSTLPQTVSHWLKRDLPARVEKLGLPVTVVTAKQTGRPRNVPPLKPVGQ